MILLSNSELSNVQGGFGFCLSIAIAGLITFAIGVIDGYVRPLKCR